MRKYKTLPLLCILVLLFCVTKAQESKARSLKVGAGLIFAVPTNNLDLNSVGGGIDVIAEYPLFKTFSVTADAGYIALNGKYGLPVTGIIPLRAGLKYYPFDNFFISGKAGLGIYTLSNVSINYLAYSFGGGVSINSRWDAGIAYDGYSNDGSFGYMAFRVGYFFIR